jgi:DNA polymerase-3 subunit epsilon
MIIFFDIESTGLSVVNDRIVQLSATCIDNDYNVIEGTKKNILLDPCIPISPEATAVHGITNEMVKGKPTFSRYAESMRKYFCNAALAGYNIKTFDVPLLSEEFARCGISWPAENTKILDCYNIFRIKEKRDLASAVKFYTGEIFEDAHDAEKDMLATVKVMKGQMAMYQDLNVMSIDDLHDFCSSGKKTLDLTGKFGVRENGDIFYTFGKHKDQLVTDNLPYLSWMLEAGDFTTETKNIAKKLLTKTK